eukprot:scaffold639500_cov42-Prasinocladus_malaysianus.AAC.1
MFVSGWDACDSVVDPLEDLRSAETSWSLCWLGSERSESRSQFSRSLGSPLPLEVGDHAFPRQGWPREEC